MLIYGTANFYVGLRAWQATSHLSNVKYFVAFTITILALCYPLGRILENYYHSQFIVGLIWIGALWMAALLYFFLFSLFFDLVRLINHFFNFIPEYIKNNWQQTKFYTFIGTIIIVVYTLIIGYWNNLNTNITTLRLEIPRKQSTLNLLKIVMTSDIHLGTTITKSKINKLIDLINSQKPDIIVLAGDILDEDPNFVEINGLGNPFLNLKSKYGTWAVVGNHEYIGGEANAEKFFKSIGINLLKDSIVRFENAFILIGRDDFARTRFTNQSRKQLDEIITGHNLDLPVILLDHQPFHLDETAKFPIDLQLSGHTHHGQLFPFNFITSLVYEKSWGYTRKNNTHFYISSGYGVWGPPIRTVNRSELVVINLEFK